MGEPDMKPLKIRRLRHGLGWTQERLGAYLGVSQALVSAWESGARVPSEPAVRVLEQLCGLLTQGDEEPVQRPTREHILDVALELIAQEGVQKMRFDAIGEEVGLTRSGIEHHFPTRDALVDGLLEAFRDELERDLEVRLEEQRARHHPRPGPAAYIDQAFASLDAAPGERTQRAALLAALVSGTSATERVRAWTQATFAKSLADDTQDPSEVVTLAMLAADAVWLLELLGWMCWPDEERASLHAAAMALIEQ